MSGTKSYQGPPGALTAYQLTLAQTSSGAITVTDNLAQLSFWLLYVA